MNYEDIIEKLEEISINLETYNDYPKEATNNASESIGQLAPIPRGILLMQFFNHSGKIIS